MKYTALVTCLALAGCTASQQTAVETAIATNAQKVQQACSVTLAIVDGPGVAALSAAVPVVAQVVAAVQAGCGTADGIAQMAQSASSVDWLASVNQIIQSGGKVVPAPVAPVPIE